MAVTGCSPAAARRGTRSRQRAARPISLTRSVWPSSVTARRPDKDDKQRIGLVTLVHQHIAALKSAQGETRGQGRSARCRSGPRTGRCREFRAQARQLGSLASRQDRCRLRPTIRGPRPISAGLNWQFGKERTRG